MSDCEPTLSYLQELTFRLALGAPKLPASLRDRHADWLVAQQRPDGGFAGREGESDPYYTAFALRGLWILGALDHDVAGSAAAFLRSRMQARESIVDLISLVFGAAICELAAGVVVIDDADATWRSNIAGLLATLRTDDGGFAKTPEGRAGSTYQTFLSLLCHELIEIPVQDVDGILRFLASQSHQEGGFLEIRAAKRAGVNPTAAAIGTLKTLRQLDAFDHTATIEFLSDMQSEEGGMTANTRIPFADLLSSFTGLLTLTDLDAASAIDVAAIRRYATSMQRDRGGFVGLVLDDVTDVEYTFYGLATLSLCEMIG
ncbi:prenyltransferase/squalene oxidase repeat-containing protein [Novipirellula artificiosorum]|uniref:Geranylgeranyl transferase type II subunit beta n=1 Tax=Novipirellula artificiosorum TaxID=2528016 RepID=A0A5C6D5Y9_9BACT|nr:prenyltransferase/squalene oxidase repeat-containing protein [Novipirellula artificiosorum]TWU32583.1 Prenyltransferase and squalene oxidase repeat protein [Novipirellula artificiosorum]